MQYLIRRRPGVTREELVAHWFANHMPGVIAGMEAQAQRGRAHASRYMATLFDADRSGAFPWDGVAQLWWAEEPGAPATPYGTVPADSFQEKAEPYVGWATTEHVLMDGSDHLPVHPLTLNAPFPCTRSGFTKVVFMVAAVPGSDLQAMAAHWLDVHAANVMAGMRAVGGFRYVVNLSTRPADGPFCGMAELYFPNDAAVGQWAASITPDGFEQWYDTERSLMLSAHTEFIGIP